MAVIQKQTKQDQNIRTLMKIIMKNLIGISIEIGSIQQVIVQVPVGLIMNKELILIKDILRVMIEDIQNTQIIIKSLSKKWISETYLNI